MWLIWKVHKETSELFIQTAQFVFRGKSRSCRPRALDLNTQCPETCHVLCIQIFRERLSEKKLHATIPKGNMGYDQYTVPNTVAIEPTFVAFLISTRKHTAMASRAIVSNFFLFPKNSELKTTHNTFQDCRVHFFRIAVNYNWDELLDLDIYLSFQTSTRTGAVQLLESWTKVLRLIYICESFCQFTLTQPLPPPSRQAHKQRWTSASRIFSRVSTLYFRKGCTVLLGHP